MSTHPKLKHKKFGTFLGVYVPSILTILGLIMYLRFGWVVGNVGLIKTITIVVLASSITFITGLSASAISTNIKIGIGGEYYMVSRSLGLEPGGAIGIPLYLCRTLSVTFYSLGLSEAILSLWPATWSVLPSYGIQLFAACIIIIVTVLSGKSASLVLKSQIPILIIVGISILALITGVFLKGVHSPVIESTYSTAPEGFWYVFAVFFPAVTGFTAGVGMSGDLKNPQRSIPYGTIGSVVSGAVIYLIVPILLSITAVLTLEELADPNAGITIWTSLAVFGPFIVYPAVWGAILSSAFGSILGGPRILQALSIDGLAPKFLSRISKSGQPTIATWVSGIIALLAVFLGGLNTIAQYVSVLFLTLYVAVNISAAIEKIIKSPSYRPKINVPWYVSITGAIGAIVVMNLINPIAFLFAFGFEAIILFYLYSKKLEQKWGDSAAGVWMSISRYALLKLNSRIIHVRNWRPFMILFIEDIRSRLDVVKFVALLGQNSGVLTISKLIKPDDHENILNVEETTFEMQRELRNEGLEAFTEVNIVSDFKRGMYTVVASHGIAGLKTNTVIFGWSLEQKGKREELETIQEIAKLKKNILLLHFNQNFKKENNKIIDIWWGGQESNGDLMLLLSYLIRLNTDWQKTKVNILSVVNTEEEKEKFYRQIKKSTIEARIIANVQPIVQGNNDFISILHDKSADSDLVFLGLAHHMTDLDETVQSIDRIISKLKAVVFVQNNGMANVIPTLLR
jgi:amino acid transporter